MKPLCLALFLLITASFPPVLGNISETFRGQSIEHTSRKDDMNMAATDYIPKLFITPLAPPQTSIELILGVDWWWDAGTGKCYINTRDEYGESKYPPGHLPNLGAAGAP